jgi:hypothetical protein
MISSRKRCEFEIHNSSLTIDYKDGGFHRVDFRDVTAVHWEEESNVTIGNKLVLSIIISVIFIIVDHYSPNWQHSGGWSEFLHSVLVVVTMLTMLILLFHLSALEGIYKWDNIIIATHASKKIIFSVDRGKGADVVLEIRGKMRN